LDLVLGTWDFLTFAVYTLLVDHPFLYQDFVATTLAGIETVCASELTQLGAGDVEVLNRAVKFKGDKALMYRANYECRTALRILKPLASFEVEDAQKYYEVLYSFPWEKVFAGTATFAIEAVGTHPAFTNTLFAVQRCKDALVDRFRNLTGQRPSVDLDNPDVQIHVHLQKERIGISLDSSGEPLFKRGYRLASVPAPLNEVLAAGLIKLSGWDGKTDLYDPFCGSGTIAIEAALMASRVPAGKFRESYGFKKWADFDAPLWEKIKVQANEKTGKPECLISASDIEQRCLDITRRNSASAGMNEFVHLQLSAFERFPFPAKGGFIIANPPYGERLRPFDLVALYKGIGDTLKRNCAGYEAWIIGSDFAALKYIGLKPSKKIIVFNGPLECRFVQFRVFSGSRKEHLGG
jgi:putative N6-adenine-specific DNA methylase